MPTTREEPDNSVDRLSARIIKFLKSHPDEAFAIEELAESVGGKQLEVSAILDELKEKQVVQGKCVRGKSQYCIGKV